MGLELMAGFRIEGSVTGNVAEVDANNNFRVVAPVVEAQAGFVTLSGEVDAGTITASRLQRALDVSEDYRLRIGLDTLLFNEQFPGASLNTTLWSQQTTTMTIALSSGLLTLNSGSSVATTVNARVQSYQNFPLMGATPLWVQCQAQFPFTPVTNNVCEWGIGLATGVAAPTDGVFWRYNASGEFRGVVNFNGTETQTGTINAAALVGTNTMHNFVIGITETNVEFWIDDVIVGTIELPVGQAAATSSPSLPLLIRCYNSGTTASAQQMRIGQTNVSLGDVNINKEWPHQKVGMGGHSSQGQSGQTLGSTANYANSANPTAAVPTNTTAALGVGLGGQFWETDTLAVTTDGIISSFQNPAGTATAPGRNLYVSRVTISSAVQTALATVAYFGQWGLAYGHTAVSLATTEGAGTKAPRRIPIGMQSVVGGTAVGVVLPVVDAIFDPPICVYPGEFIATIRKKVGTAPATGVLAHSIKFNGYWE
jgi:hypothetical protein